MFGFGKKARQERIDKEVEAAEKFALAMLNETQRQAVIIVHNATDAAFDEFYKAKQRAQEAREKADKMSNEFHGKIARPKPAPLKEFYGGQTPVSVGAAKTRTMAEARDKGTTCPVCDQFVKVYKRKINSFMARQLIHLYSGWQLGAWVHAKELVLGSSSCGDFSKLQHWGLIEKKPLTACDKGKSSSGYWRLTHYGLLFAQGKVEADEFKLIYNNKCLGADGGSVTIQQALGDKFDYSELMA